MKKQFLLASLVLSLLLLTSGMLWPINTAAMPVSKITLVDTETPPPVPILKLNKVVTEELVNGLDGDGKVDAGDTVRYEINYENIGNADATEVIIVDDYDETLIESIAIDVGGKNDGSTITWELGTLAAGDSGLISYKATLKATLPPGTTVLGNEVTIFCNEVEPIRADTTVQVQRPELTITKTRDVIDFDGNEVIGGGDIIKYTITYENIGNAVAANVVVFDDYDETLIANISTISDGGEDDGSVITWELGTVKARVKASLTYEAELKSKLPPDTTSVDNTVEIRSDETYPVHAKQSIPIINLPNLTITKEIALGLVNDLNNNGITDPGDTVKYDISYENIGDADATEVIIIDDYNETLIESIAIDDGGKNDGSTITWELGTLAAGDSGSVSYEATLKETFPLGPTELQNEATISSNETEPMKVVAMVKVEVTPTPTPVPPDGNGPSTGIFAENPLVPSILIGILALCTIEALIYVGAKAKYDSGDEDKRKFNSQRIEMVREGVFITFTISAILILAIGSGIEAEGAISVISAIVGYVFGRATSRP